MTILDDDPEMVNRRDTVMVRLLHACCKFLSERNTAGVLVDGIKAGEHGFELLGKRTKAKKHARTTTDMKPQAFVNGQNTGKFGGQVDCTAEEASLWWEGTV